MFQAGKKVLLALYAVNTMFCLTQPSVAMASTVENTASNQPQNLLKNQIVSDLQPVKIATFEETRAFMLTLRTHPEAIIETDDARYATAEPQSKAESSKASNVVVSNEIIEVAYVTPAQTVASASTVTPDTTDYALNPDVLFNLVNQHRSAIGLSQVQKEDRVMQVAQDRAPELFDEIFVNGNMHAGFNARQLPYHSSEIIIYYNTEEGAMQWWLHSPVHKGIIQDGSYTHAGIACSGKSCTMIFASF